MADIDIKLSSEEIQKRLKDIIKPEYSDNVSECIIGLLEENAHGLETVFKATMGILPIIKYEVGDVVLIKGSNLASWYIDHEQTELQGYSKKGLIPCLITDINKFAADPYGVTYSFIEKDKLKEKEYAYSIRPQYVIRLAEEFPLDDIPSN